jgi:hypothetical protein
MSVIKHFPFLASGVAAGLGILAEVLLVHRIQAATGSPSLYAGSSNPLVSGGTWRAFQYLQLAVSSLASLNLALFVIRISMGRFRNYQLYAFAFLGMLIVQLWVFLVGGDRSATIQLSLGFVAMVLTFAPGRASSLGVRLASLALGVVLIYFAFVVGMARSSSFSDRGIASPFDFLTEPGTVFAYLADAGIAGEATPAHAALYYMLSQGVEPFHVIPLLQGTYAYYADAIGLPPDQGFTIHLVAGWWLSVGPLAPLFAAIYLYAIIWLFRRLALLSLGPWTMSLRFIAATSALSGLAYDTLRGGPDGLRATIVALLLVPAVAGFPFWYAAVRRAGVVRTERSEQLPVSLQKTRTDSLGTGSV